jgi:DNA polymerase-4
VLLAASRRVERPSADEAFVDLSPEPEPARGLPASVPPVRAAETIRDELQRRLGLDASLGLASSRLAARAASSFARPRGLLVVLPGYERSFVAPRPVSLLGLPPHVEAALERAGLTTVGQLADAEPQALAAIVGPAAAKVGAAARGEDEPEIALAAPPAFLQEEAVLRDRKADALALLEIAEAVARRAARRLRPLRLNAGAVTLELRRSRETVRRTAALTVSGDDPDAIAAAAHALAAPLVEASARDAVRGLVVRLSKLQPRTPQAPLFPSTSAWSRAL